MQQLNVVICGFDHYENIDVNPSYEVPEALVRDGIGEPSDVDDPLLERAEQTGVAWEDLAEDQVNLFREDMTALRVLPPDLSLRLRSGSFGSASRDGVSRDSVTGMCPKSHLLLGSR